MSTERSALNKKIILLTLAGFLMPPVVWLASLSISNLVESWQEMFSLALSPLMHVYILAYMVAVVLTVRAKLRRIDAALENKIPDVQIRAAAAVRSVPAVFVFYMSFYCLLGPSTPLFGKEFITPMEYLLAELMAVPIILVFAIPFLIALVTATEQYSVQIPLSETRPFYSVGTRMVFFSVVSIAGALLFMFLVSASLILKIETLRGTTDAVLRLAACGILMAIIAVVNLLRLRAQITRPVRELDARLKEISGAQGDLAQRLDTERRDEFGTLARSFNQLMQRMALLVEQIRSSAERISGFSSALSETADTLGRASEDQSQRLRVSLVALHEVGNGLEANAQAAQVAHSGMDSTRQNLSLRQNDISDLSNTMTDVSGMVQIISDIARRTNMLALNATIEAARAGEYGRGFGVVADEVGKLASTSRDSAADISQVVATAQQAVKLTVGAFAQMDREIHESAALVESIASVFVKNSEGLRRTRLDMDELGRLAESLAGAANGMREAATAIRSHAGTLLQEVSHFRTT